MSLSIYIYIYIYMLYIYIYFFFIDFQWKAGGLFSESRWKKVDLSSNSMASSGFEDEKTPWTIVAQDSKGQLPVFKKEYGTLLGLVHR